MGVGSKAKRGGIGTEYSGKYCGLKTFCSVDYVQRGGCCVYWYLLLLKAWEECSLRSLGMCRWEMRMEKGGWEEYAPKL